MDADALPKNAPRFSRYRSVRKAIVEEQQVEIPAVPHLPNTIDKEQPCVSVARAPTRYRRPTIPRGHDAHSVVQASSNVAVNPPSRYQGRQPTSPPQVILKSRNSRDGSSPPSSRDPPQSSHYQQESQIHPITPVATNRTTRYRSRTTSSPNDRPLPPRNSYDAAREEARLILDGEYDRLQRLRLQQEKAEKTRKMRVNAKAAAQLKTEEQVKAGNPAITHETPGQPVAQRSRKWTIDANSHASSPATTQSPQTPETSRIVPDSRTSPQKSSYTEPSHQIDETVRKHAPNTKRHERSTTHSRSRSVTNQRTWESKVGDGPPTTAVNGTQLTVDAPVSAVNAGERRVDIRCEKSRITLPVTPTTTVKDLLNSASVILSQPIDPRTAVAIETYYPLGLERPLRRYEHIRDVMNSWDSDTQNYLMILPQSECAAVGLEQKDAPGSQPPQTTVQLLHSQRPGKWEKHWMMIRQDGQVTASNKDTDRLGHNVFHLSDFDVYTPTKKELKKIRPPKKICFAIKSQQRSIMFESTENFVHFFCTNDKATADEWYSAVQRWRSWYLVNVLEAGTGPKPVDAAAAAAAAANTVMTQGRPSTSHSRDSIPYQLGTFEPLLDFSATSFTYDVEEQISKHPNPNSITSLPRSKALVDHARSKSISDRKVTVPERRTMMKGRRLSASSPKRQLESHTMTGPASNSTDTAFTGTGLLARAFSVRKTQAAENAAYLENTDNAFTGNGLLARKLSNKKFHRENPNSGVIEDTNHAFTGAGLLSRNLSVKKSAHDDPFPGIIPNTNEAFTGGGMLSVQRALTKKRSAMSTKPGQPLVDLAGSSEYVDGSLLRKVEAFEIVTGANLPLIDRSRGVEVTLKTGEV